jgi:hypothetical protein
VGRARLVNNMQRKDKKKKKLGTCTWFSSFPLGFQAGYARLPIERFSSSDDTLFEEERFVITLCHDGW